MRKDQHERAIKRKEARITPLPLEDWDPLRVDPIVVCKGPKVEEVGRVLQLTPFKFNESELERLLRDPVLFVEAFFSDANGKPIKLYDWQKKFLRDCAFRKRVSAVIPRQAGKTFTVALFCLYWAFVKSNQHILIVAPTLRQSQNLFQRIKTLLQSSSVVSSKALSVYVSRIEWDNGSTIRAVPTGIDGHTILGFTVNVVILEESGQIRDFISDEVVTPMLAATDGKMIQIGTPVGRNHFWRTTRPDSGYAYHHIDYNDCIRIGQYTKDFIDNQKKDLTSFQFNRQYAAIFTETDDSALPVETSRNCVDDEFVLPHDIALVPDLVNKKVYIGMDVGRFGASSVISVISVDVEGKMRFEYYKELKQTSFDIQEGELNRTVRKFGLWLKKILIDSTGMGLAFVEHLGKVTDFREKIVPVVFSTKKKEEMFNHFLKLLEDKKIRLPNDITFLNQCDEQLRKTSAVTGNSIYSCPEDSHDDILWSLILACYGTKQGEFLAYSKTV